MNDPARYPPVTVAVINFNGRKVIDDTLASIAALDYPGEIELIVVDDFSTDDSVSCLRQNYPQAKVFEQPQNAGLNAGRNRALQEASHDLVLLSDNDMAQAPNCLKLLVQAIGEQGAMATPMILDFYERDKIYSDSVELHYLCMGVIPHRGKIIPPDLDWTARKMVVGSGGMLLVRKSIVFAEPFNGLDAAYRFGYDEGEFAVRLTMAGHDVIYVPRAKIFHHESAPRATNRTRNALANRWRLMLTAYAARTLILCGPAFMAFELVQLLFLTLKRSPLEWFRAVGWILGDLPTIMRRRQVVQNNRKIADRDLLKGADIFIFAYRLSNPFFRLGKIVFETFFNGYWRFVRPLL